MIKPDPGKVIVHNRAALVNLQRALKLGAGQFSLILVRVNYRRLRRILLDWLGLVQPFQKVELAPDTLSLRDVLKRAARKRPRALVVNGFETIQDLEVLFKSANLGRDAYFKTFRCPVVLCISDTILQTLNTHAPDFKSFAAAPIRFEYPVNELSALLHRGADELFEHILDVSDEQRLGSTQLHLPELGEELRSLIQQELPFALADLDRQQANIDADLQAGLQFLQGREAHQSETIQTARACYEASLTHWAQSEANLDKQAVLLFHLGLWWRSYAVLQRATYIPSCEQARRYFEECLSIFRHQQCPDRTGRFIHALAEVLQKLGDWDALSRVAQEGTVLHAGDMVRLARDYGYLAEVALAQQHWERAQQYAETALAQSQRTAQLLSQAESPEQPSGERPLDEHSPDERPLDERTSSEQASSEQASAETASKAVMLSLQFHQGWYLYLLGQANLNQGKAREALKDLERARQQTEPRYDLTLYRKILEALRELHFQRKDYLQAFHLKLEQRRIENQFGLRAFIGAGQIQPYHHTPYLEGTNGGAIAPEIRASGRQKDILALVARLVQPQYPIVIIHGQSGVGKSSIVSAGLVPTLRQVTSEGRTTMPVLIKSYHLWQAEILQALSTSVAFNQRRLSASLSPLDNDFNNDLTLDHWDYPNNAPTDEVLSVLDRLRQRTRERYEQVILIFDQFEEFFFERPQLEQRLAFYQFLRDCINEPYIKVVLAIREDYLHYLLEWDRLANLDIINNDILSKEVRYYLGNFSPEDADMVIRQLAETAQLPLEDSLIKILVQDLAEPVQEVRPIELQIVGAELQRENITTLQAYRQLGPEPKEKLVRNFLNHVIHDCGPENADLAQAVLYLLSSDGGTRPLKTRLEIDESLELAGILSSSERLDIVLEILSGSGVIFEMPDVSGVRYQLVHDYLSELIQEQDRPGLITALKNERRRRKLTEDQLRKALKEQGKVLNRARRERHRAEKAEIRALMSVSQARLLSHDHLGALLSAVKGTQRLMQTSVSYDLRIQTILGLWQALHTIREKNQLVGHRDWVLTTCFSPDGERIASASDDSTVIVWSRQGKQLQVLEGHRGSVLDVAFSADGELIATGSDDRTIRLWRADGELLQTLVGPSGAINSLAFSPTEPYLASASNDHTLQLWSLDGKLIKTFEGHQDWVRSVNFSPDGQWLVSASEDTTVKLWPLKEGAPKTLQGHAGWVLTAVFAPDGQHIVSGGDDHTLRLWSLAGQLLKTFEGHQDWVRSVCFSPKGDRMISGSDDKTIKIWDARGMILQTLRGHRSSVLSVDIGPDGETVVSASDDDTVRLWRLSGHQPVICQGHQGIVWDVCWQPQGDWLVSTGADGKLKLWHASGELLQTLEGHQGSVYGVAWSSDGQRLASASADGTVKLWRITGSDADAPPDAPLLSLYKTLEGHQDAVWAVAFSPNGETLATAGRDRTLHLWQRDGTPIRQLEGHQATVWSLNFSPDGRFLVSASEDCSVRVWDWQKGTGRLLAEHGGGAWDAVFSPGGQLIGSGGSDSTLRLWTPSGKEQLALRGHRDWVRSLCFSPDRQMIASASDDTTIRLWSRSGRLLQTLDGHRGIVWRVTFDSAGERLASASADGTVRIWNLRATDLLKQSCRWLQDY
ncbi:MAG: hypothetical protein AAF921_19690, partial [Cyanobacteria bacterium P01_D01_bin.44]